MLGDMSKPRESAAAARWREIVRGQAASGLSVAAYCRRAGTPQSSFYAWRRKLKNDPTPSERRDAATFAELRDAGTFAEAREAATFAEVRDTGTFAEARDAATFAEVRDAGTFAEVRVVGPAGARNSVGRVSASDGALEVRLPNGRGVLVRPGFDPQTLLDLVTTLEHGAEEASQPRPTGDVASVNAPRPTGAVAPANAPGPTGDVASVNARGADR